MDDTVLTSLADRLRALAGQAPAATSTASTTATPSTAVAVTTSAAEERISEVALLTLQQSLRRHPAIQLLGNTPHECRSVALREVQAVLSPSSSSRVAAGDGGDDDGEAAVVVAAEGGDDDALQLLHYINATAQQLEEERLSGVYANVAAATARARRRLRARLGLDATPPLHANSLSFACPWNVLFTLLAGAELTQMHEPVVAATQARHDKDDTNNNNNADDDDQEGDRACAHTTPQVANATAHVQAHLQRIQLDVHDGEAWLAVLHELDALPLVSTRAVWLAALHHFPTAGVLAVAYVTRELDELQHGDVVKLHECVATADARAAYVRYLRLLNVFFRHLPLTYSCPLYRLFFDFVSNLVQPDARSLDTLYRTCLRRDVGHLPQSGELWLRYTQWHAAGMHDMVRRREWRRRMYRRMLQSPLDNLDVVRQDYELFVAAEYRNRVAPDERADVDRRFARARAEAAEMLQRYAIVFALGHAPWHTTAATSSNNSSSSSSSAVYVYLPRPCTKATAPVSDDDDDGNVDERRHRERRVTVQLWLAWHGLLEHVAHRALSASHDVAAGGGDATTVQQHHARCLAFLRMRACALAYHEVAWAEYMHRCAHAPSSVTAAERQASVREALDTALQFVPHALFVRLYAADVYAGSGGLDEPAEAVRQLEAALTSSHAALRRCLARGAAAVDEALTQLQHMATISVNWMRLCVSRGGDGGVEESGASSSSSSSKHALHDVARHVMHTVDLASLTRRAVALRLHSDVGVPPAALLRPFNVFCHEWLKLTLAHHRGHRHTDGDQRDGEQRGGDGGGEVVQLLAQWAQHLQTMLSSATSRGWSAAMCGVDDTFLDSCAALLHAAPSPAAAAVVLRHVRAMQLAVRTHSAHGDNDDFVYLCKQLRHRFFAADAYGDEDGGGGGEDGTSDATGTTPRRLHTVDEVHAHKLVCRYAAPMRCDTAPYSRRSVTAHADELLTREAAHHYACALREDDEERAGKRSGVAAAGGQAGTTTATTARTVAATYPDEGAWCALRTSAANSSTTTTARDGAATQVGKRRGNNSHSAAGNSSDRNDDAQDSCAAQQQQMVSAALASFTPRHGPASPAYRPHTAHVQAEQTQSLADLLARCAHASPPAGGHSSMPPLHALQELIEQLPTVYEYSCDGDVDGSALAVEWLARTLRDCKALR